MILPLPTIAPPKCDPAKKARIADTEIAKNADNNEEQGQSELTMNLNKSADEEEESSVVAGKRATKAISPEVGIEDHTTTPSASTTVVKRGGGAIQATITVKTIIPHPTNFLIDPVEVEDYADELKIRIQKLSEYCNANANIYALGKLLPTATWGPYRPVNDRSKILCDPATGEPLTIWVVGHIAKMWFAKFGKPESQASLTVMPLSQTLAKQSGVLLAKFSSPMLSLNPQTTHMIRAIKWQNTRDSDKRMLFDAVYDARKEGSLKTYNERPIWKLTDLKPGDLILLEMKMSRYSRKGDDNKWHSRAQYEMIAISLLCMGEMPEEEGQGSHHIDGLAI